MSTSETTFKRCIKDDPFVNRKGPENQLSNCSYRLAPAYTFFGSISTVSWGSKMSWCGLCGFHSYWNFQVTALGHCVNQSLASAHPVGKSKAKANWQLQTNYLTWSADIKEKVFARGRKWEWQESSKINTKIPPLGTGEGYTLLAQIINMEGMKYSYNPQVPAHNISAPMERGCSNLVL